MIGMAKAINLSINLSHEMFRRMKGSTFHHEIDTDKVAVPILLSSRAPEKCTKLAPTRASANEAPRFQSIRVARSRQEKCDHSSGGNLEPSVTERVVRTS